MSRLRESITHTYSREHEKRRLCKESTHIFITLFLKIQVTKYVKISEKNFSYFNTKVIKMLRQLHLTELNISCEICYSYLIVADIRIYVILLYIWIYWNNHFRMYQYISLIAFISKPIPCAIGINSWYVSMFPTLLWLLEEDEYMRADMPFLCLPSLMWWFGQRNLSKLSSIEMEGNLWTKKKENMKKKTKAPTCGQLCGSWANTPFHHRGLYSNRTWPAVGTYGTCDCFLTPITPTGDHLAASHSTNNTHPHC